MKRRKIAENVYWMGAIDWDRRLFDSLIPLPDGTSYNAYLIEGSEKTALLDTVDPSMKNELIAQLQRVKKLDYIISHHAEQDHSGTIPAVLDCFPQAKVVTSSKGKGMIVDLLNVPSNSIVTVEEGDTISLGGKTLEFIYTPWVHWPETMVTYLREDRILFSCDFFGSHLATTDLFVKDRAQVYEAAKRYYAEIMMPFRRIIQKNLAKVKKHQIDRIAPSHGPIHDDPAFILDAYEDWVADTPKNVALIPYISMHGSTERMVNYLVGALAERGVSVYQFDLSVTDLGKLAIALVDAATIIIGTPTVHVGAHPGVFLAAYLTNILRPKLRYASIIGSYGWSSKAIEQVTGLIPNLNIEVFPPVLSRGDPDKEIFQKLDELADAVSVKHRELVIH
jgi:flavorubredoxin